MIATKLWHQLGTLKYEDIPVSTRTVAKQCLLDWTACVVAATDEPLAKILRDEFGSAEGACSLIGTNETTTAQAAAMINGATGHALDFDDTNIVMGGHPSVPVVPAVWAMSEEMGATGEQLLTAMIVGLEVECRLGKLIGGQHYARGWHVTSTMGVFGACAGVSYLLKLSEEEFGHAFGLAASQASGLKANFGTMTKPFHAGHAAERGLISARLAKRGFTSNAEAFECNQGLMSAASEGAINEEQYDELATQWLTEHTLFKYNAACYLTHASIEALKLMGEGASEESCASIELQVHPSLLDVCGIENPETGLEAKFSLRANAALTVLGFDTTDPATYSDANIKNEKVQLILQKVRVKTDKLFKNTQSKVIFHRGDGKMLEQFFDTGIPATDLVGQQQKLEAKFHHLVSPKLKNKTEKLRQFIMELESAETISIQSLACV
ncbi:MAG: MmgE/PrpD family protein [Pseudomonadales bacterium]|nr:MmgE/PrpD family protein [Pseudomonadales bacterium]